MIFETLVLLIAMVVVLALLCLREWCDNRCWFDRYDECDEDSNEHRTPNEQQHNFDPEIGRRINNPGLSVFPIAANFNAAPHPNISGPEEERKSRRMQFIRESIIHKVSTICIT